MPSVAAAFGKVLGPAGKMPSPQLGIVVDESATSIKNLVEKISKSVKLRVKEPSIKVAIGCGIFGRTEGSFVGAEGSFGV
jgi:ribosomal protein L1